MTSDLCWSESSSREAEGGSRELEKRAGSSPVLLLSLRTSFWCSVSSRLRLAGGGGTEVKR